MPVVVCPNWEETPAPYDAVMLDWDLPGLSSGPPAGNGEPRAAVLAALFEQDGDIRLVLTKRPMHMPTHPGDLAFPGGKPKPGESPVETALREAREEVGILPESVEIIGFLDQIHTVSYERMVVPVVGRLAEVPELVPDPSEVARILLPTLTELRDPTRWRQEDWDGHMLDFFELEDEILWGATARMVRQMLGLSLD